MIPKLHLRISLSESQAETLQNRLTNAGMKITYHEEQHGPTLVAVIGCTNAQEKTLREILDDIGILAVKD